MKLRKVVALFLVASMILSFTACARQAEQDSKENRSGQEKVTEENDTAENILQGDPVTDSEAREFEERAMYLYREGVYPEFWWAEGANARGIGEDLNRSLDLQIPETEYYHVDLFQSIEELKQATEQAVTKEYAEKYLYRWGEQQHMFAEYEGELYANAYWEGEFYYAPKRIEFVRKDRDVVFLDAYFLNLDDEPFRKEIQLKQEDGTWKFQRTHITEFFEEMLSEE